MVCRKRGRLGLDHVTDTTYNSFIRQWACFITRGQSQWNLECNCFGVASTYPFKAFTSGNISLRLFCSKQLSWLVHRLWPHKSWLSKKYTLWRAAILVMDATRRYFDLKASFSFLDIYVYMWCLMVLVIIVDTLLSLWECRSWNTTLDIWYLVWRLHRTSSHSQKQAMEWIESMSKGNCVEPYQLHTSPKIRSTILK